MSVLPYFVTDMNRSFLPRHGLYSIRLFTQQITQRCHFIPGENICFFGCFIGRTPHGIRIFAPDRLNALKRAVGYGLVFPVGVVLICDFARREFFALVLPLFKQKAQRGVMPGLRTRAAERDGASPVPILWRLFRAWPGMKVGASG